jgi:hypothetical protein
MDEQTNFIQDEQTDFSEPYQDRENCPAGRWWRNFLILAILVIAGIIFGTRYLVTKGITPFILVDKKEIVVTENDCKWLYEEGNKPLAISEPGLHWRGFGRKVTRYPKEVEVTYSDKSLSLNDLESLIKLAKENGRTSTATALEHIKRRKYNPDK